MIRKWAFVLAATHAANFLLSFEYAHASESAPPASGHIVEKNIAGSMSGRSVELYARAMGARAYARTHLREMSLVLALFLHKQSLLPPDLRPGTRQAVLSLSRLTQLLQSQPGSLNEAELSELGILYRTAAQSVNDAVRGSGMEESEVVFSDPVFELIRDVDLKYMASCRVDNP